jgi:hypothetical protein
MTFEQRKKDLVTSFNTQLDKTFNEYPNYKAGLPNDYDAQLTKLNVITTQANNLQTEVEQAVTTLNRDIEDGSEKIKNYQKQNNNLRQSTSPQDLDATSKRMLDDSINEYNNKRLLFWIKLSVILLIVVDCVYIDKVPEKLLIILGATFILCIIYFAYKSYTSKG